MSYDAKRGNGELHLPKSDTPTNASARTLTITNFVYDQRPPNGHEGEDTSHTYLDPVHFPRSKLSQIEVTVHPIRNTSYP